MKIGFVMGSVSRNAGGLLGAMAGLGVGLEKCPGISATVFGVADEYSEADRAEWGRVPRILAQVRGPRSVCYCPGMYRSLEEWAPDVVHSVSLWGYPTVHVNRLARRREIPYLVAPHGQLDSWALANSAWKKRVAMALCTRRNLAGAACLHALNANEARSIRALGLRNPICVIPNGVDVPDPMGRKVATPDGLPEVAALEQLKAGGRKILLYLGRIHPKKGLRNLIQAWTQIQSREVRSERGAQPDKWTLVVAGWDEGGHEAELQRLASRLRLRWLAVADCGSGSVANADIVFVGPQFGAAKTAWFGGCDGFVLPSYSEGLPLVVLEAWSHGKPVVMTPECNLEEGFAVGAAVRVDTEVDSVADGLSLLFSRSEDERVACGEKGRLLVERCFRWPKIAADMADVYRWIRCGGAVPSSVQCI